MDGNYFQWDNELLTGVAIIDAQHQGLVEIINTAMQLCVGNEIIYPEELTNLLNKLNLYVDSHFKTELKLMEDYKIDPLHVKTHLSAHEDFQHTLTHIFSDINALLDKTKLVEVVEFLIRWLAYHIMTIDKCLSKQIQLIQRGESTPEEAYKQILCVLESPSEPLIKAFKSLFLLVSEKNKELEVMNAQLEGLNEALEDKVKQRTEELFLSNEKLRILSIHDELTGLYNRRYAVREIDRLIKLWERYQSGFSVLYIDVDKFKKVNDNFGHDYGDLVLKWISSFLETILRKVDVVCRIGGDEFLVICSHCDATDVMNLADKLNAVCKERISPELTAYWKPSLSIGVAEMNSAFKTSDDILKHADMAMYEAKNNGGGYAVLAESHQE